MRNVPPVPFVDRSTFHFANLADSPVQEEMGDSHWYPGILTKYLSWQRDDNMCHQADLKSSQYQKHMVQGLKSLSSPKKNVPHLAGAPQVITVQGINSPKPRYGNKFMIPWMEGLGAPAKFETVGAGVVWWVVG